MREKGRKKRKYMVSIVLFIFTFCLTPVFAEEKELSEAKLLMFERKWKEAELKLEKILKNYPESARNTDVLFYLGQCLQEQGKREEEAINVLEKYLNQKRKRKFSEEAEIAIIDLSYELYKKGNEKYLENIKSRLNSHEKVIRYYSAFKLSYLKNDQKFFSVPVLKEIVKNEKDPELKERAKIALLRIDPTLVSNYLEEGKKTKMLRIALINRASGKQEISIKIPVELVNLALQAISKSEIRTSAIFKIDGKKMRAGDINEIIQKFLNMEKAEILEIDDEESIIKIWIE